MSAPNLIGKNFLLAVSAVIFAACIFAQQPRLNPNLRLDQEPEATLPQSVHPAARRQQDIGPMDSSRTIHGVSLYFRRSAQQQAELELLLLEQQTPGSPNYRKWLMPQQVADRFGMNEQDLVKTARWLQSQGMTVDPIPESRDHVSFSGTVAQIDAALHTQIRLYSRHGEVHFANATDVLLPAGLAGIVQSVRHLHDFRPKPRVVRSKPHLTSNLTGNTFATPDDFATIYGVKGLYARGIDGTGRNIAIIGQTQIDSTVIDTFRLNAGLPATKLTPVLAPNTGASAVSTADLDEAYIDVEWSGGVAKNATITYVYAGNQQNADVFDAMQYAINSDIAPVISISYGNCEVNQGTQFTLQVQSWMQTANLQGQTVLTASGDQGAADCEDPSATVATHGLGVDVPASIPEVTGVGGTSFLADVNVSSQFWNPTNNASNGSAKGYIGETGWNDTSGGSSLSSSGGGISGVFAKPIWQIAPGVPADGQRDVPDVALNASPNHDGYIVCSQNTDLSPTCTNGFRDSSQSFTIFGGTSAGAPAMAGILTLIEQATNSAGEASFNPTLYRIAADPLAYPLAFHDITTGNNQVPCTVGTTNCTTGTLGYTAGAGYDLVTGLGTVDAYNLEESIAALSNGKTLTSTTVQASSLNPLPAASVTFTARVGAVNQGGPATTGFVQFLADGDYVQVNGSVLQVPVANGVATYQTSFPSGGYHTVSATYFGSAALAGSDSLPVSVLAGNVAPASFSLSASPVSLTVPVAGGTQSSIVTLQGWGGYSSQIALFCAVAYTGSGVAGKLPACAITSPVTLSAADTIASSTLTVSIAALAAELRQPLAPRRNRTEWWAMGGASLLGCVFLVAPARRKCKGGLVLFLFCFGLGCGVFAGCSGLVNGVTPASASGVIAGPYSVTVTATPTSGMAQTTTVVLTVQ